MPDSIAEKKCPPVSQSVCDLRHKSDREYIDLSIEVIKTRLAGMDTALQLSKQEADRQYDHLNNLRASMVPKGEFDMKMKEFGSFGSRLTAIETRSVIWTAAITGGIAIFFTIIQIALYIRKG